MNTFRILFTGSRSFDREDVIHGALNILTTAALDAGFDRVVLVHGACPTGGDAHADAWYRARRGEMPLGVERHPADWKIHKRPASSATSCSSASAPTFVWRRDSGRVQRRIDVC